MQVGVLGQVEVGTGSGPVRLTSPRLRQIVAALTLARGRPVSFDALVDVLWGDHPPASLPGTLHAYVAGLRKSLEPHRRPREAPTVLVTAGTGYALVVPDDGLDVARFESAVTDVDRRMGSADPLAPPLPDRALLAGAVADLDAALSLWRGDPYSDLGDLDQAVAERARLEGLRTLATEDRAAARLALGEHGPVAAELEAVTHSGPVRERPWLLQSLALNAGGRQADALEVLRRLASVLDDELGLEPSPVARDLQTRILRHDPTLLWHERVGGAPPVATAAVHPVTASPVDAAPPPSMVATPDWPLVERSSELAALVGALDAASAGRTSFATVTGEPGIGKTRLCQELAAAATARGARVLSGRCSQDDGAPPLWPWRQVLAGLGRDVEVPEGSDEGAGFRAAERLVGQLRDAAGDTTVVVVLDDLHWADVQTLRVLRLAVETLASAPLLVVCTWRPHPEPTGALAEAAGALSRAHAVRLEPGRLSLDATAELLAAVGGHDVGVDRAADVADRTDGNPFYVVEFARLGDGTGQATPGPVHDVVRQRLDQLAPPALATVRAASVVGRTFDLDALSAASGAEEDDLLEHLEQASAVGLLREEGVGRWSFGHALVRDTAYADLGPTRAARAHARVAALLGDGPTTRTEAAHHWLAAGPAHAAAAWRAASAAAADARRVHAHEEAAVLLRRGLETMVADRNATPLDRYGLLMELVEAERSSGQWNQVESASAEALDIAERLDDPELVAAAAGAMTRGAFWQTTNYAEVHHRQVAALRGCLERLPPSDSVVRCRTMGALAMELYYASAFGEREALVEEALAMAHRLGDDDLVVEVALAAFVALWRPSTRVRRLELLEQALPLARRRGDAVGVVTLSTLLAVVQSECGQVERMWETWRVALPEARRLRLPFSAFLLLALAVPWWGMEGRHDEARAVVAELVEIVSRVTIFQTEDAMAGAVLGCELWGPDAASVLPLIDTRLEDETVLLPIALIVCLINVRCGRPEEAARILAERRPQLPEPDWFSPAPVAAAAEVALWLGDADLARRAYEQLAPMAGQSCQAGSALAIGPADAFLALAAATLGERDLATRHADAAAALMEAWGIPRCSEWFAGMRERFAF